MRPLDVSNNDKGLCHCLDCRKLSGSPYSFSFVSKRSELQITSGKPKEIVKTADSNNKVLNYFCGDCGKLQTLLVNSKDIFKQVLLITC